MGSELIVWFIGMSGAGKTTIGRECWRMMKSRYENTVFLDGDLLRDIWGEKLGHTVEARRLNAHRISHLCKMLDEQGINVVACVLSIFPEWLSWNRENFSSYFEVFVDVPLNFLEEKDTKGLYADARSGAMDNVVGIDIPFPRPIAPDMVLQNSGWEQSPVQLADSVIAEIDKVNDVI